jgi:hypothetical protein
MLNDDVLPTNWDAEVEDGPPPYDFEWPELDAELDRDPKELLAYRITRIGRESFRHVSLTPRFTMKNSRSSIRGKYSKQKG